MKFGGLLRELRRQKNLGIKKAARELGVNYTYLSKLENDKALPSEELIERIVNHFGGDRDLLYVAANKVQDDVMEAIRRNPKETLNYLRSLAEDGAERTR